MRQKNWPRENNRAETLPRPFCVFVVVFVNVVFVFQCFSSTKGEKGMFVVMLLKHLAVPVNPGSGRTKWNFLAAIFPLSDNRGKDKC